MRTLYHQPLDPFCRKVRILLAEKDLDFDLVIEPAGEDGEDFAAMNPTGDLPVLVDENGAVIVESVAICEYLEEVYPSPQLLGRDPYTRAEVRRLSQWFDVRFAAQVTHKLVDEKIGKRLPGGGGPDSAAIRAGIANIGFHLSYIRYLVERRNWLAGDELSVADFAAAAHLSCVDYLGDVPWQDHPEAKDWYARIKSRPAMRFILADHIAGMPPPIHYANLDF